MEAALGSDVEHLQVDARVLVAGEVRWSKKPDVYLALIHFAFGIIAWRQCLSG